MKGNFNVLDEITIGLFLNKYAFELLPDGRMLVKSNYYNRTTVKNLDKSFPISITHPEKGKVYIVITKTAMQYWKIVYEGKLNIVLIQNALNACYKQNKPITKLNLDSFMGL